MVIHVGIDGFGGYVAAYNDITREIIEFETDNVDFRDRSINKVNKICEKIHATLFGEFGYACIFIPEYYTESYRKEFMNNVKQIGFKKAFIIGKLVSIYLECFITSKEKPSTASTGDIFWIFARNKLIIWEKTERKSKIIQFWHYILEKDITESNLLFYKLDSGIDKNPNMIFVYSQYSYRNISDVVKKIFPACKCIFYNSSLDNCKTALIKARIAADDQHLDVEIKSSDCNNFTENKIEIWIFLPSGNFDKDPILYLDAGQPLPLEKTIVIPVKSNHVILNLKFRALGEWYYPEMKITPKMLKYGKVSFVLKIDENFIVSYDFVVKTVKNTHQRVKNFYANQIKSETTYNIPQKNFINNVNINAVGIDLGMTRSCVAVNRRNGIELVAIDGSERQLPSYISFKEKDPICGQLVINQLEFYANSTVFDIKRIIGRNFNELQINSGWPFEVIKNDMDIPLLRVQSCEGTVDKQPEEISAILLEHMKQKIEEFQGKIRDEVVITVPAGFNMDQKIATHVAADLAGFTTVHLLAEPIAASIAYFVDRPIPSDFNMLLFDLGGGTLDLCIFKVENNKLKIISVEGDSNLGGRDFDMVLFQHFEKILETRYKIIMNEKNRYRLIRKCMDIKHTLSTESEASLDVSEINFGIDEFLTVTRQEFEKMASKLLDQIGEVLKQTFSKTNIFSSDINKVLLVGGGCRMPMIQLFLRKRFPKADHTCGENPDEMVAIGAAYYSSFLLNNTSNCSIM